ncbi:MAG: FGGY-family carbohydrate kinase [Planctomycetota bacterium]|jgi:xylulokinase
MSTIGLDIGTTGCKAVIFSDDGSIFSQASREYSILTPHPGWAEQDPELVCKLASQTLAEAVTKNKKESPQALALSVQGEAIIPVDKDGKPLRNAILGMDTRSHNENRWLADNLGEEHLFNRTGMPLHTVNTLPKMLWIQRNEPDIWKKAGRFLLYEDFFLLRLGGLAKISHCLASRTQMYDLATNDWADDILAKCHIDRNRLASLVPQDGGVVGKIGQDLARSFGLNNELLLVSGGHDQACAALGSGVIDDGLAMVSTGTAEVMELAMSSPALNQGLRQGNISVYRHVVPKLYLAMTLNHSGGLLLRWFRDNLCKWECQQGRNSGRDPYDLILADTPNGPTDIMVLPHFAGSGTPLLDITSKGAIVGLNFATTQATIAKAILEGLTFELRLNLELLQENGAQIKELHAVGGGARSPLWLQLKADICQVPLRVPKVTEAACLGAALLAGVAAGKYTDLATAVKKTVHLERAIEPDRKSAHNYDQRYKLYKQMYPTLIDIHRRLAK